MGIESQVSIHIHEEHDIEMPMTLRWSKYAWSLRRSVDI